MYQKQKEISVLVFVQIDLIQIEYWNRFTYKLMWYDRYHVSNLTRYLCIDLKCNRFVLVLIEVELILFVCFSKIKKSNSHFLGNQSGIAGVHDFIFIIVIFWYELQLVDLCGTREIYKIERYRVKEC